MKRVALLFAALLAYAGLALAAVNINSATKEQLESLDGVGPVKAQAIIDYRKKNGPFKKLEDVKNVDGIGEATYDKIKGNIQLSGTTKIDKPADDKKPAAKPEPKPEPKAKAEDAKAFHGETISVIDKAVQKGILHRNAAARHKARLTGHVNKLAGK